MSDSIKLSEMQRSSIEFERQRHLANWFIKSSPHMATPTNTTHVSSAATTTTTTTTPTTSASASAGATTENAVATTTINAIATATKNTTSTTTANQIGSANHHANGMSSATAYQQQQQQQQLGAKHHNNASGGSSSNNPTPVFFLVSNAGNSNGNIVNGKHNNNASSAAPSVVAAPPNAISAVPGGPLGHFAPVEGRKPKLRRFNSHDTSANMFSVADFENARLARRNEIEMKQRLARRMRMSANGGYAAGCATGGMGVSLAGSNGMGSGCGLGGLNSIGMGIGTGGSSMSGGDYSTGDSKASKYSNESQREPLPADIFLDRYSLPRVVRISYKTKFSDETLQSSSSNGSSTATTNTTGTSASNSSVSACGITVAVVNTGTSSSTASSSGNVNAHSSGATNTSSSGGGGGERGSSKHITMGPATSFSPTTATTQSNTTTTNSNSNNLDAENREDRGELFLLYRLIRQRHILHGHNAKTAAANRKKGVLIPQEFPGYFSLLNDKGMPTATLYTSLIQLVRERVYKFVSVDNMPAFTESQPNVNNPPVEGCIQIYNQPPPPPTNNRPQYVKTTARGGQVFRLLAVFEDGKQDHATIGCAGGVTAKANNNHGREKEKGRYAQLLNENRQVLYVSLSTKGKYYEIEPGIPQILQKLGGIGNDANKKPNPDCVHRITALVTPQRELPLTLRYISGPHGCNSAIPENVCITHITTENVMIACPIEDVEVQSPLHLRKLHLSKEMNLLKSSLGFESEQRMLANPNVQNILKYCQFNCDQFLKMVEVEVLHRPERSGSKSRGEGLKILKPLHLPKLLRREKTTISAHEKEDSIIFLSKSDLANLEAKETAAAQAALDSAPGSANRITEKMKVFQTTKKKWFRKQDKHAAHTMTSYELDMQAKRMSMERYSDMSKLLQERFGDKPNAQAQDAHETVSELSGGASDIGCSDTETTTLATIEEKLKKVETSGKKMIKKSMSLQDIELISGCGASRKPDLLPADTISEAGTDLEDVENMDPIPQSFITEKLYNEFHVKTRQYSKSSSSLHQLLNFSRPQKMQLHDNKRSMAQLKHNAGNSVATRPNADRRLDFNIGEPVTGRRAAGGLSLLAGNASLGLASNNTQSIPALASPLTPTSLIDDLPYSSVRDSLVLSSDESASDNPAGNICQALNLIDYNKENIYAEICHDSISYGAASSVHSSSTTTTTTAAGTVVTAIGGIRASVTRDTFSADTHSTQVSDDYGDYASLTYAPIERPTQALAGNTAAACGNLSKSVSGQTLTNASVPTGLAISRVQINCNSVSPVSYHTVYLGDESLQRDKCPGRRAKEVRKSREHVTTVALEGNSSGYETSNGTSGSGGSGISATAAHFVNEIEEVADNIYNTLK